MQRSGWSYSAIAATAITAAMLGAVIFAFVPGGAVPAADAQVCPPGKTAVECTKTGLQDAAESSGLSRSGETPRSLTQVIGTLINAALSLTGAIFIILMIYGGFLWMQARGNTEDVTKAKEIIRNAILGIVVLALAFAITNFVISRLAEVSSGAG